jgi:hypothetical protein
MQIETVGQLMEVLASIKSQSGANTKIKFYDKGYNDGDIPEDSGEINDVVVAIKLRTEADMFESTETTKSTSTVYFCLNQLDHMW